MWEEFMCTVRLLSFSISSSFPASCACFSSSSAFSRFAFRRSSYTSSSLAISNLTLLHLWRLSLKHEDRLQTVFHHLDRFCQHALNMTMITAGKKGSTSSPRHLGSLALTTRSSNWCELQPRRHTDTTTNTRYW